MSQPFDALAVMALEFAPQRTVAEQYELDSAVTNTALSSLFTDTAANAEEPPTPEAHHEEASEQVQDSQQVNERTNPQAVGTSTVRRKSSTTKRS